MRRILLNKPYTTAKSFGKLLTYSFGGDTNGAFNYIGTSLNATSWVNPTTKGLIVTASSISSSSPGESSIGTATTDYITDRQPTDLSTYNFPNNWYSFYLAGHTLTCNYYALQSRTTLPDYYPRNWEFQGSNDGAGWDVLDTQVNNNGLNTTSQWLAIPINITIPYSYFRIYTTGLNSSGIKTLSCGEVELYGLFN